MKSIHSLGNEHFGMAAIELRPQTITVPFQIHFSRHINLLARLRSHFTRSARPLLSKLLSAGVFEISNLRFISLHRIIPGGFFREIWIKLLPVIVSRLCIAGTCMIYQISNNFAFWYLGCLLVSAFAYRGLFSRWRCMLTKLFVSGWRWMLLGFKTMYRSCCFVARKNADCAQLAHQTLHNQGVYDTHFIEALHSNRKTKFKNRLYSS